MGIVKKYRIWFGICSVIALGVVGAFLCLRQQPQPTYQGRNLSYWFDKTAEEYGNVGGLAGTPTPAFQAVVEMDGDAVPYLAGCANEHASVLGNAYEFFVTKLPGDLGSHFPRPHGISYFDKRRQRSLELLYRIAEAQNQQLSERRTLTKTSVAEAIPAFRNALKDKDSWTRIYAAQLVWTPAADALVPELAALATNADTQASMVAASALGKCVTPGPRGVSVLCETAMGNRPVRFTAIQSIGLIGPGAGEAVGCLTSLLASDPRNRSVIIWSLGRIGPAALPTINTLAGYLGDEDSQIRFATVQAIATIGTTPDSAVATVTQMTHDTNDWVKLSALMALWNRDPKSEMHKEALIEALRGHKQDQILYMIFFVRRMSGKSAPFLPYLKELSLDADLKIRFAAEQAVEEIQRVGP